MRIHTVVIGGGQAGLAMSAALTEQDIDHVVLERGRVANVWRTQRWDSFRLLSPNWMTRLPGFRYDGSDPNGYMATPEILMFFERYAARIDAPVEEHTAVRSVRRRDGQFVVTTDGGVWTADAVVVATGATAVPRIPLLAADMTGNIAQFTPATYKRPAQLPDGNVLVVGGSASGAQLASELQASGKQVVLASGRHTRLPRTYRGADTLHWLDIAGVFDDPASGVHDLEKVRHQPSLQLVGSTPQRDLDLNTLQQQGVRLTGHLIGVHDRKLVFADDLRTNVEDAEAKLDAVLARIDPVADAANAPSASPRTRVRVPATPRFLDVRAEDITSVVWATGFRTSYPWLELPVVDRNGAIRQREGITEVPGLYTIGLRFQRVRKSNFIDGVGGDALLLAETIAANHRVLAAA